MVSNTFIIKKRRKENMGLFDFEEAMESSGFWILAGGGIAMEVLGYVLSKRAGIAAFPIWQLLIVMAGTVVASVFFATRD
jgi:hypothetical protein